MAELQTGESFYEILDGSIYDKVLLQAAEDLAKDGEVGYEAAKSLWTQVGDETGRVSEVDVRTMDYIMKRYKFERTAVYFLQEAVKLEKQSLKIKAKEAAKAAGMSPRRSPAKAPKGSPKAKATRTKEEPYTAILRITEEINQASSLSQVKRLQKQLEHLSPMKVSEAEEAEVTPAKAARKSRGPAKEEVGKLSAKKAAKVDAKVAKAGAKAAKAEVKAAKAAAKAAKAEAKAAKAEGGEVVMKKPAAGSLLKGESKKLALRKGKKAAEAEAPPSDAKAVKKRPAMGEKATAEVQKPMSVKVGKSELPVATKKLTRKTSNAGSDKGKDPPASPLRKGNKLKLTAKKLTRKTSNAGSDKGQGSPVKKLTRKSSAAGSDKGDEEASMKKPAAAKRALDGKDKSTGEPAMKRPAAAPTAAKRPVASMLDDAVNAD